MREGKKLTHLSKVELRILLCRDALNLDEGGGGVGVALAALVAEDASLGVESTKSSRENQVSQVIQCIAIPNARKDRIRRK